MFLKAQQYRFRKIKIFQVLKAELKKLVNNVKKIH